MYKNKYPFLKYPKWIENINMWNHEFFIFKLEMNTLIKFVLLNVA
jgi:hypothetical protein